MEFTVQVKVKRMGQSIEQQFCLCYRFVSLYCTRRPRGGAEHEMFHDLNQITY